jgi:hypothetical protein
MTPAEAIAVACARLGARGPGVLARIAGPIGKAAAAAVRGRREVFPDGITGVHTSWLAALPPPPHATPVRIWLARRACAGIPPMPPIAHARRRPATLDDALALTAAQLREWLVGIGIDQLVYAVGPGAALDDLIHRAPRAAASAQRIALAPRLGQLGPRRAAIARSRGTLDDTLPLRIGARAIAPYVARQPLARVQLRYRLSKPWGELIDSELRAHAADPLEHAPTWLALSA